MSDERKEFSGTFHWNQVCIGKKFEPGSMVPYHICLPPDWRRQAKKLALYVLLEHDPSTLGPMLSDFMKEDLIPYGLMLFCNPGELSPSLPGGEKRGMRAEEFDQYGPEFSNFLVEELIPEAVGKAGVSLDASPDMHFITGGSSGGLAAWNAVWFRNDYFHRVFLSSPTFSAMRGGEEPMVLLRKTETRPIRIYLTVGTEEPDYFFGSSLLAAQNAAYAFEFAGYDFRFEQFNGEGHCSRRSDVTLWRRLCRFLWANWRTQPVIPLGNQIRIRNLIARDSKWKVSKKTAIPEKKLPITKNGTYTFNGGEIYLEKGKKSRLVATGFGNVSAIALSSDKWRMYIADTTRRFVYAMSVQPDGSLTQLYKLAPLALAHDCRTIGAADLVVLADDRVLVATELGIQGIVSFGLMDLILPMPGDVPAERLWMDGKTLFAVAGGKVYCRELKIGVASESVCPPTTPGYSDNFNYNRSHFTHS